MKAMRFLLAAVLLLLPACAGRELQPEEEAVLVLPAPGPAAATVRIPLRRGTLTDNGATPWYAVLGLGTPAQELKYMIDTGTTHSWITSALCRTGSCRQHGRFNHRLSSTFTQLGDPARPLTIDFGPWGRMKVFLGRDQLRLPGGGGKGEEAAGPEEAVNIYLSLEYQGAQFDGLACDGGIAVPATPAAATGASALLPLLKEEGKIAAGIASFWYDPESGRGECLLGNADTTRYDPLTLNPVKLTSIEAYPELWIVPLDRLACGEKTVLTDIPFALDTGSSRFKGDPEIIARIRDAVTAGGARPAELRGENPDLTQYPPITLTINGHRYPLTPEQYFTEVSPGNRVLAFHPMEGLDGLLLVGSVFLESVYSIFYYETETPRMKAVALAAPIF